MRTIHDGKDRRKNSDFDAELRLLEMVTSGAALDDVFQTLGRLIEAEWGSPCRCRVLLASQFEFRMRRLESRPNRSYAPVQSSRGKVLGALIVSHRKASLAVSRQRDLLLKAVHIARIAIEHARGESALRRSEGLFATTQRVNSTGSFRWRLHGDEIHWSDQLYRLFDFEIGSALTLERICERVHPDDRAALMQMIEWTRTNGGALEFGCRLLLPDAATRHLHVVAQGARDAHGAVEVFGAVQDVTLRHAAEAALNRARAELARVARVASVGALTASISHEVNQPLSGVVTNAGLSLRLLGRDPVDLGSARDAIRRTLDDGMRACQVVGRLRELFRRCEVKCEPVDLNEAARDVIALAQSELQRKRIVLETRFASHLPTVVGDRIQLQQVILNLVLNAADSLSTVEDRPRTLGIETEEDDDGSITLSVRDSGKGLESHELGRIFDPFYSTKPGGMGIGLFISRSIIESHHGDLRVAGNDGPGATFSFSLPGDRRDHAAARIPNARERIRQITAA